MSSISETLTQEAESASCRAESQAHRPSGIPPVDVTRRATVRIMTFNIEFGLQWAVIRERILAERVDILCLQEVPEAGHRERSAVRPRQILADFPWPHDCAMLWHRRPRRIGNMTLVRGRIGPGRVLHTPLSAPYGMVNQVEVHGTRLTIANVHMTDMFGPPPVAFVVSETHRLREALDLGRRFRCHHRPVVALGDFNTFWPAPGCWVMRRDWTDCRSAVGGRHPPTRPTYGLPFVIDHVFVRGDVRVLRYRVLPAGGSDHRAVIADLSVPAGPVTRP